jgi:hypothetical protein
MSTQEYGALSGVTQETRGKPSLRELLRSLIEQNRKASKDAVFKLFKGALEDDVDDVRMPADSYFVVTAKYWFTHNYDSIRREREPLAVRQQRQKERDERRRERVTVGTARHVETVNQQARVMLLEMVMPNGKTLGKCTGAECVEYGSWLGKWLGEVGKKVGPKRLVGDVMSEKQLLKMKSSLAK